MIPRRLAVLGVAALLLGVAGVAAAVTHDDGDSGATAAPTTTTVGPTTTTNPPQPTFTACVTSTTAGATTTTAARSTTTVRPATTTTTITTTTNPTVDCVAAQIDVSVTTDQRSYAPGQQVKVDSTLRNRSQTPCFYAGHTFQVAIQDAVGRPIMTFEIATPGTTRSPFVPGATLTGSVPWDQRTCQTQPCPQPPPGPYVAAVKWVFAGGPYEARAAFSLTP